MQYTTSYGWIVYPGWSTETNCSTAYIFWDFFDHDGILDWWDAYPGPAPDYTDSENVNLPVGTALKTLWNSFSSTSGINSLQDIYTILKSLDINGDGLSGTPEDIELVDEIFILHNAPGGQPQI